MHKRLTAVVIGNSNYAFKAHVPFLRNSTDVELAAISSSRTSSNTLMIPTIGMEKAYQDYKRMLAEIQPDLVVISSAPGAHFDQILDSLRSNTHVLVDKAMVCSASQAQAAVNLAKEKRKLLGVAVQRRYDKSTSYMREVLANDAIGKITLAKGFYCRRFPTLEENWRNKQKAACGGITIDSGYHLIDTLLWILDSKPISVYAQFASIELSMEDVSILSVRLENGIMMNISLSYLPPKNFIREEMSIFGTDGALLFARNEDLRNPLKAHLIQLDRNGEIQPSPPFENKPTRESPIRNFVNAILKREELLATGENSLGTVALIDAAYLSAQSGNVVAVNDVL